MISFTDFLIEAEDYGYSKYLNVADEVRELVDKHIKYNIKFNGILISGGSLEKEFKHYDTCVKAMQEFIDNVNKNKKDATPVFLIAARLGESTIKKYEEIKKNFQKLEQMYSIIFKTVKIGDDVKSACEKLAKMSKSVKYFNPIFGRDEGLYFKPADASTLIAQSASGFAKLVGVNILNVQFKNNKVIKVGF